MPPKVSVIIPVYNAERYLRRSVESAVLLEEVLEVILIEDRSPDNAYEICQRLSEEYSKVRLLRHPGGENRGAGASRNLGMRESRGEYLAFLDADDYYLPQRFESAVRVLTGDPACDGTYAPVATRFEEEELQFFGKNMSKSEGDKQITFVKCTTDPARLFDHLVSRKCGSFHTNGITFRRSLLKKTGIFNEDLRLHQDMDLWYRMAFHGRLVAVSEQEPVAVRVVHQENRIHTINHESLARFYESVFNYFKKYKVSREARRQIFLDHVFYYPRRKYAKANVVLRYAELSFIFLKVALKRYL